MNFRVMIARAARLLGLIWAPVAFGYLFLVAYYDWPWPEFFDLFPDNVFMTLFIIGPMVALVMTSEKIAPAGFLGIRRYGTLAALAEAQIGPGEARTLIIRETASAA